MDTFELEKLSEAFKTIERSTLKINTIICSECVAYFIPRFENAVLCEHLFELFSDIFYDELNEGA